MARITFKPPEFRWAEYEEFLSAIPLVATRWWQNYRMTIEVNEKTNFRLISCFSPLDICHLSRKPSATMFCLSSGAEASETFRSHASCTSSFIRFTYLFRVMYLQKNGENWVLILLSYLWSCMQSFSEKSYYWFKYLNMSLQLCFTDRLFTRT